MVNYSPLQLEHHPPQITLHLQHIHYTSNDLYWPTLVITHNLPKSKTTDYIY